MDLFDSARAYWETLETADSREAIKARRTLDLLLWHDVRRPARGCWTSRIQRAIATMSADESFAWQWLLRNSPRSWNSATGGDWREEAKRRLITLSEDRFLKRIDEWFVFPKEELVRTSVAGGHFLCLLVLYCGIADRARTLPMLERLSAARWSQRGRVKKMVDGLTRVVLPRQTVP
jgi:hypothetical protein